MLCNCMLCIPLSDIKSVAITAGLFKTAKMAGDGIRVLHTALCRFISLGSIAFLTLLQIANEPGGKRGYEKKYCAA